MADSFGGWTPAPGESPQEREKRLKREKRQAQLAAAGLSQPGTASSTPAPSATTRRADEDYGGWKPAEGESPAEREKRIKREKRQAMLAAQNGSQGQTYGAAPSQGQGQGGAVGATRRADENYGGWQPMEGESPAEREKRLKREKRAAMLGASSSSAAGAGQGAFAPPPSALAGAAEEGAGGEAEGTKAEDKKSKHQQSKTPARLKYLERKKKMRKAKKKAAPKGAAGARDDATEVSRQGSVAVAVAGTKRKREDDDDEGSDDDGSDADAATGAAAVASAPKWPDLSPAERAAKEALIASKKAERRTQRLAKKAELKRLKAEGAPLPPPRLRVVERTKPLARMSTTVVQPPPEEEEGEREPTEEEIAERKKKEEIAERKKLKALKKLQRRQPDLVLPDAAPEPTVESAAEIDADGDAPMLIPTAPPPASPSPAAAEPAAAALLRLPSATRPAPPSAAVLSALKIHAQVRDKVVVDPTRKVVLTEEVGGDGTAVSERGRKRLRGEMGVQEWFAVQTATLPLLLPSPGPSPRLYDPHRPPRDVLVSAPTGSGKTLSYVVPIVETLAPRLTTRLRALVLLPTRDLVAQVRDTFEQFAKGTGLRVGVATGQHSFAHERSVLVGAEGSGAQGGSSLVDILIATPGRLMDHLKSTPGFSLQHVRFLVVDEADRLLTQSFHEWLPGVLAALKPQLRAMKEKEEGEGEEGKGKKADPLAPTWWDAEGGVGRVSSDVDERCFGSCQKLLFSATLSRDPAKIDALQLNRPVYISVEDALQPHAEDEPDALGAGVSEDVDGEKRFTFPAELKEHMIVSPSSHKPLYLFHLLLTSGLTSALCFTKSVEAATRLAKLVEFFFDARRALGGEQDGEKVVVRAFSSELAPGERKRVLKDFKDGRITMLIASDLIARGIDLPAVSHVVSYDVPADMRKYVHRVGRTARAGRAGDAWSLVEEQEVAPFKAIMATAQHLDRIERVRVKDRQVEGFVPAYQVALEKLKAHFATGGAKEKQ
ncbi:hypothetical protein JCM10207_002663 [Rhodosporidiobolus poonsookiae]